MVRAYRHRPAYPPETFAILTARLPAARPTVLDVGCGTGDLALVLAAYAERVDAVDVSEAMLAVARERRPAVGNVAWILGAAENAPLRPPYGLVTAGESRHWLDWAVVLRRLRRALHAEARIAIVERREGPTPWAADRLALIGTHPTNRAYTPYRLPDLLEREGLFRVASERRTQPLAVRTTIGSYIEAIHSRNDCSSERMAARAAAAFDREARALLGAYPAEGRLSHSLVAEIAMGR